MANSKIGRFGVDPYPKPPKVASSVPFIPQCVIYCKHLKHGPHLQTNRGEFQMRSILCSTLLLGFGLAVGKTARADDVDDLLKRVPSFMNTVAVFQVDAIMKSPRGIKEKWAEKHQTEVMAGASSIPTNAKLAVVAAHINPESIGEHHTVAMIPLGYNVDMNNLAAKEKGVLQLLGDQPAILSPRRGYLMNLNNQVMASATSFDRQDLGRWVRFAVNNKTPVVSKYLQDAIATHKRDQIVFAMDLQDMFDPQAIRIEVIGSNVAQGNAYVVNNFSKYLNGVRGLTIAMNFDDNTNAEFRIDFDEKPSMWEKQLTEFIPKFINEMGASLEEFASAKIEFADKSLLIKTKLSDASLRQILSLIATPTSSVSQGMAKVDPKATAELTATLRYYRAVNQVIDDMGRYKNKKQTDYNNAALWYDSFATKIDKLSIAGVDDEMVTFGSSVANKMRALASSLRGLKIQLDAYDSYMSVVAVGAPPASRSTYRYGSFSSPAMESNVGTLKTKQADLVAKTAPDREKVWTVIEQDRSTIRRKMAEKYKIDFDQFK